MRRGRAREPSLPCCDGGPRCRRLQSFLFSVRQGSLAGEKGGASSVHERSDGVMGVCVCARTCVCGISIFLLSSIHHVSCLFYAERKERQMKDDQRFIFMCKAAFFFPPFHSCCSAIGVRRYFHARRASHIDYFIKNDKPQVADTCTCNPNNIEELSSSLAKTSKSSFSSSSSLSSLSSLSSSSSSSFPKIPFQN